MISHMIWQLREQLMDEIADFGVHLGYDGLCRKLKQFITEKQ